MKKTVYRIEVVWGSDFQELSGGSALDAMLECFYNFYKDKHKDTKIDIRKDEY